ncbi:restriction endonuclease subunit S [Helicobacter pylori]|uniref:restriction endonuclease subunit S n=1 Tax=Helicobacter pylori TaxID=210 RepID=UPI00356ACB83
MIGPLSSQLNAIKWGEFRLGDLFEIEKTLSFNKDALTQGQDYDYITRTSQNQGVLQTTGFVNAENLNPPFTWSLGLLQMDFFYRKKSWYAGQFMRKITPKTEIENKINLRIAHYFTTLLNALKRPLLSVLVRDIDKTFREQKIQLPLKPTAKTQTLEDIDFDFMEKFIAELEQCRLAELEQCRLAELQAYLKATGLENTTHSSDEENALNVFNNSMLTWQSFKIVDIFEVKNTRNILARDVVKDSGTTPYLCASKENNAVNSYINYNADFLDKGNCIFIGGKTFVVTYQQKDFYSNDSHNLALYLKDTHSKTKLNQLFIITCIYKALNNKYSWGDSISNAKIQNDSILPPITQDGGIDFNFMRTLINALMKQTIHGVAEYCSAKIQATKEVISQETPTQKDSLF